MGECLVTKSTSSNNYENPIVDWANPVTIPKSTNITLPIDALCVPHHEGGYPVLFTCGNFYGGTPTYNGYFFTVKAGTNIRLDGGKDGGGYCKYYPLKNANKVRFPDWNNYVENSGTFTASKDGEAWGGSINGASTDVSDMNKKTYVKVGDIITGGWYVPYIK